MGHALGCLAITLELGHEAGGREFKAIEKFFYHYLIARQLGDDAHDWKDDLRKGQINAVGALLIAEVKRPVRSVRALYEQLERYFWKHTAEAINRRILDELAQARAAIDESGIIKHPAALEAFMQPIEASVQNVRQQQRKTAGFLRTYRAD
jgi:hypothetical protein